MDRQVIETSGAPSAIGPYNQAIKANGFVFTAGQIALVPGTTGIAPGGVAEQTERVLANLAAVLEAAGTTLSRVVKTTVYLKSMRDFPAMNEVYGRHFPDPPPARSTVAVRELPMDVLVEIDVVALAD